MKKLFLILSAALTLSLSAAAQDTFYPDWYFGIKGGAGETAGEVAFKDLISPFAGIDATYQFSPVFGVRADLNGWQGKGAAIANATSTLYKYNFAQLNLDLVIDLCNIFKYRYDRGVNPYLFLGIGGNLEFNNDEANAIKSSFPTNNYLWDGTQAVFTYRGGAGISFRCSDKVSVFAEAAANLLSDKFNSKVGETSTLKQDYHFTGALGVRFALGNAAAKRAAVAAEAAAAAEAARLAAEKAEKDRLAAAEAARLAAEKAAAEKEAARLAAEEKAAAEKAAAERAAARAKSETVLFYIDTTKLRPGEQEKIDNIIAIMKEYPEAVVDIIGYADKNTGNAPYNMKLSERRAQKIASILTEAGIDASRINSRFVGDTEAISATPAENRAVVMISK